MDNIHQPENGLPVLPPAHSDCHHFVGYLYPEVPPALVGGRARGAIVMKSELANLVQSCRQYFASYPTTRQMNERFLVMDDDAKQLNALLVQFRFCPLCGEQLNGKD